MQTESIVNKCPKIKISYSKYIVVILLISLFSFYTFPSKISIGQPEMDMAKRPTNVWKNNTDFLNENRLRILDEKNKDDNDQPHYPALSQAVLASKFTRYGSRDIKQVALTFDDGPYLLTEKYLEVLNKYDVPATFFLIGIQIDKYPDSAKLIIENNYEIGIHSYAHKQLTKMGTSSVEEDFEKCFTTIGNTTEEDVEIRFFRPPFGDFNDNVIELAKDLDLSTILWSVDPLDWKIDDPNIIANHVVERAENGSIILLHEGRQGTLSALPAIIQGLRDKDFEIVSLSELLSSIE